MEKLEKRLNRIDGRGYKSYKDIKDVYQFTNYELHVDHVQGDPYAAPSRISVRVPSTVAAFDNTLWSNDIRRTALEDYIGRCVGRAIEKFVRGDRGLGKSGEIAIEHGRQQVLVRNAVLVTANYVEARLTLGLPARGRTVLARQAYEMFFDELPRVVDSGLLAGNLSHQEMYNHVNSVEDQQALRHWLDDNDLVAFIANESHLPRASGIDDRPLKKDVVKLVTPDSLSHTVNLPNSGAVTGMGIPRGVTLIVGGGFHGKSTLLHALEFGVYNHIPGDGRERVVSNETAVKIRAEDGRVINHVDISSFIDNLPLNRDTKRFSTENASGSTSQAANIMEALHCGARVLLIDEDTSATNFMIRDERMQALVAREKEPITPFLHRIRELYKRHGVSTVIVMGGTGDYFEVSDTVIMMDNYQPHDVTAQAKELAGTARLPQQIRDLDLFHTSDTRTVDCGLLNAARGKRESKIDARGIRSLIYGIHEIDLSRVEQLVDVAQTRAIGLFLLYYAKRYCHTGAPLVDGINKTMMDVQRDGLDLLSPYKVGNLALPRLYEIVAAINRVRAGH
jgi:predicted ABC-class ATPase